MSANKIGMFVLGLLLASVAWSLVVWIKTADSLHDASHEWEAENGCLALEHLYAARPIHKKSSAHLLGTLFATGDCVKQDVVRAEEYYIESGLVPPEKLGERLFYAAEIVLEAKSVNFDSDDVKVRVGRLAKRARELGFKPTANTKIQVTGREKDFLLSLFN